MNCSLNSIKKGLLRPVMVGRNSDHFLGYEEKGWISLASLYNHGIFRSLFTLLHKKEASLLRQPPFYLTTIG